MGVRTNHRAMEAFVTTLILLFVAAPAMAAWSHDSQVGNPVSVDPGHSRGTPVSISDGAGGTLHAWLDAGSFGIAMQHLDADGNPLWGGTAGIPVFNEDLGVRSFSLCSDGAGGAYLGIEDGGGLGTDSVVYIQHVDAAGNLPFTLDPIMATPVYDPLSTQAIPAVAPDGSGGVFVVWTDTRNAGMGIDLFGQHINAAGNLLWGSSGLQLVAKTEDQDFMRIAGDGSGGFYLAWFDLNGLLPSDPYRGYLTHIDTNGSNGGFAGSGERWLADNVSGIALAVDGLGNVVVAYSVAPTGSTATQIRCSHNNPAGNSLFFGGDIIVADAGFTVQSPKVAVGPGNAIYVSWRDNRLSGTSTIYSQALDFQGNTRWTTDGVAVDASAPGIQGLDGHRLTISSDGYPTYVWGTNLANINAQQLGLSGLRRWASNLTVADHPYNQRYGTVVADFEGGAVFTWLDGRDAAGWTIRAERVDRFGYLGNPAATITTVTDYPQDQGGKVRLSWDASYLDSYTEGGLSQYTVWNRLAGAKVAAAPVDPATAQAVAAAAGIDEATATAALADGWTYLDQVPAAFLPQYGYNAPTFADSVAGGAPLTDYMVISYVSGYSWTSRAVSGISVDNLAPGAPQLLTAYVVGGDVALNWQASGSNDGDLQEYRVYRAPTAGVTPGPGNLAGVAATPTFTEPFPAGGTIWHYVVTAVDVHGNEGIVSNEAATPSVSAVDGSTLPTRFALRGNSPNPFNPSTEISFELPRAATVELAVFDVAGHRVATLLNGSRPAGRGTARWNGRDDTGRAAPSGIYFARLVADDYRGVWKMMLAK